MKAHVIENNFRISATLTFGFKNMEMEIFVLLLLKYEYCVLILGQ